MLSIRTNTLAAAALALLANLAGCSDGSLLGVSENSLAVSADITLAGSLVEGATPLLQRRDAVVIDLRRVEEGADVEATHFQAAGVAYENLPVGLDTFGPETVRQLDDLLTQHAGKPIVIHCASGNRASLLWAALQKERGVASAVALSEVAELATKDAIKQAIEAYGS